MRIWYVQSCPSSPGPARPEGRSGLSPWSLTALHAHHALAFAVPVCKTCVKVFNALHIRPQNLCQSTVLMHSSRPHVCTSHRLFPHTASACREAPLPKPCSHIMFGVHADYKNPCACKRWCQKRRVSKLAHLHHMLCLRVDASIQVEHHVPSTSCSKLCVRFLHDKLCSTAPVNSILVMIALVSGIVANDCNDAVSFSSLANVTLFVLAMQHWLDNHLLSTMSNCDKHSLMIDLCHLQTAIVHQSWFSYTSQDNGLCIPS